MPVCASPRSRLDHNLRKEDEYYAVAELLLEGVRDLKRGKDDTGRPLPLVKAKDLAARDVKKAASKRKETFYSMDVKKVKEVRWRADINITQ